MHWGQRHEKSTEPRDAKVRGTCKGNRAQAIMALRTGVSGRTGPSCPALKTEARLQPLPLQGLPTVRVTGSEKTCACTARRGPGHRVAWQRLVSADHLTRVERV